MTGFQEEASSQETRGIRAVCFDIGDTLVYDTPPMRERVELALVATGIRFDPAAVPHAFRLAEDYALAKYVQGASVDDKMLQLEAARIVLTHLGVTALNPVQLVHLASAYKTIVYRRALHPEALPLIDEMKRRGFLIAVVSDWEATLPALLNELGLGSRLDALAVSAIVGVTKPSPKIFQAALAQLGLPREQVIHVGDYYELDVIGARAAGMIPILFDWKQRKPDADCHRVTRFDDLAAFCLALEPPGNPIGRAYDAPAL